jgi:hypothetical protein
VRCRLDILLEQKPREETQGEFSLLARDGVDVNRIFDLFWRDKDICSQLRAGVMSSLIVLKSLDRPCPMNMQPRSTSRRSFL